jgi:mono/diheme cytochrome c family protein
LRTDTPRTLAGAAIAFSMIMLTIAMLGIPGHAADPATPAADVTAPDATAPAANAPAADAQAEAPATGSAVHDSLPPIAQEVLAAPDSARVAEVTFVQNCAYCHGNQGSGGKARSLQCRDLKADYLFDTITNGRKRGSLIMPPWKDSMDERTRWQLTAYIMGLKDLPSCTK